MIQAKGILKGKINSKGSLKGKINNGTQYISISLEDLEITPSNEEQVFNHPNSGGYDKVKVKAVAGEKLNVYPTTEKQEFSGLYDNVTVRPIPAMPITITPITEEQQYDGIYGTIKVGAVTNEIDENITPDNIKNGVEILGVTGTLTGGKYSPRYVNTSAAGLFKSYGGTELDYEVANLDTSAFASMSGMFSSCTKLLHLDLSGWNTSNVANMSSMFNGCSSLTDLILGEFYTGNVTSMASMFYNCSSLPVLDVSTFDIREVTSLYAFVNGCRALTSLDLSSFDAFEVTNVNLMFNNCGSLTNLVFMNNLGASYTSANSNYANYSLNLSSCNKLEKDSLLDVINKLYDLNETYDVANGGTLATQKLTLSSGQLSQLTADEIAIATNKGWTVG